MRTICTATSFQGFANPPRGPSRGAQQAPKTCKRIAGLNQNL